MRRTNTTPHPHADSTHSLPPRPLRNNVRRAQAVVQAPINQSRRTKPTEPAIVVPTSLRGSCARENGTVFSLFHWS